MIDYVNNAATTEAVIYLKDGKRKHGMLIDQVINNTYQFISSANFSLFQKTNNVEYIETVAGSLIEAIDTNLK